MGETPPRILLCHIELPAPLSIHVPSSLQSSMYSCCNPVDSGNSVESNLAVVPAKIVISVPRNSGGFRNGHGHTRTELTGTESTEFFLIVIVNFKCNTNYLILITIN
jgi:hypothetical protein